MSSIKKFSIWWLIIIVLTLVVSAITSPTITVTGMIYSLLGHLAFAVVISLLPLTIYWLIRKPLNLEEFMATVTTMWLFLAIANLTVM